MEFEVTQPFTFELTTTDQDLDQMGHVNNKVYLAWCEDAATRHSSHLGWGWDQYQALGCAWVVRRHELTYLAPAFKDETITVATWTGPMRRSSAQRFYQIVRNSDGKTLVKGNTDWVFVDLKSGWPKAIPEELQKVFAPTV